MKKRYGEPLFRVPIDFNFGCSNREADGSGGCTFCSVGGSPVEDSGCFHRAETDLGDRL